ncbi:MAG TPA: DUF4340 domain-containing protein, partial [Planctomycetota bacterium]|nr:DUF4340 domain-containing protein [Planctomycetota bacterium]
QGVEKLTIWQTPQGIIGRQEPRDVNFTIEAVRYDRTFRVAVAELRNRVLVPMPPQDIVRIEIDPGQGQGERIQLRRAAGDAMRMFWPVDVDTDAAAVNDLLVATERLRVVDFVDGEPGELGRFGLDRGFLTVSLHPRLHETAATVLHFGRDEGEHTYVKRDDEPFVAKVERSAVDVLRRSWQNYATRSAATNLPSDAATIRYRVQGEERAVLTRDQGTWRNAGGADVTDQAADLLEILAGLRGRRVFDGQDPAVANELAAARQVEIEVRGASGASATLVLHDRGKEGGERRQAWVVHRRVPRIVIELGPSDTTALLAPLGER